MRVAGLSKLGGPAVCLAIPGKILEISSGNQRAAPVDVAGVRRRSIWHWSKTMHPALWSLRRDCAPRTTTMNTARPPQPSARRVRTNVELLLVLSHPARSLCPGANRECLLESTSKPVRVLPRTRISPAGPRGEHPQKKMLKLRNEPTISFRISESSRTLVRSGSPSDTKPRRISETERTLVALVDSLSNGSSS